MRDNSLAATFGGTCSAHIISCALFLADRSVVSVRPCGHHHSVSQVRAGGYVSRRPASVPRRCCAWEPRHHLTAARPILPRGSLHGLPQLEGSEFSFSKVTQPPIPCPTLPARPSLPRLALLCPSLSPPPSPITSPSPSHPASTLTLTPGLASGSSSPRRVSTWLLTSGGACALKIICLQ